MIQLIIICSGCSITPTNYVNTLTEPNTTQADERENTDAKFDNYPSIHFFTHFIPKQYFG